MEILKDSENSDLETIKEWLTKQPHLPQNIDDTFLKRFLHASNNSLEQTKNLIDLFYTIRSQIPEIFANRDPKDPQILQVFDVIQMVPLPKLTKDGRKLLLYRFIDNDPDKYSFLDTNRAFFMMADTRLSDSNDFTTGEVPIFDMAGYSLKHLTKVHLPILKKYMTYTQEAHPIKLKQIHLLNVPPFLDKCLALLKPFMKSEVAAMLNFHLPNSETLYDFIPRELLPEEYGGSVGKLAEMQKIWLEKLLSKRNFFIDETKWKVDESKRSMENKHQPQMLGIQGSFRALNID